MSIPQPVIRVSGIRKSYGRHVAVDDVSFEVNQGEIFGLIGPNGAGKTTTMECVEGLRTTERGTISVLALDPFRNAYQLQDRIGVQLQESQLQKRIKVWEAIHLWASLYPRAVDGDQLLEQLGLAEKRNSWFMTLSGGQKQRLFIALALINDPELVFLDELTTGLDPQARRAIWGLVGGIRERGKTVFLTTHPVTDNENRDPSQYDPFCVTAPGQLPGVGGNEICGFHNVTFAAQPIPASSVVNNDEAFGVDQTEVYDGVDFEMNARFSNGALLQGGYNLGRTVNDECYVVDSPQDLYQCRVVVGIAGNQQIKLSGSYPLPWGGGVSFVLQNLPAQPIQANTTFTNDQIAPSLGRNLSACPAPTGACNATVSLPLLEPNGAYEERLTQLDFRLLKDFTGDFGRMRVTFDLYNMLNSSAILSRNNTYGIGGVGWGQPTNILNGRLIKIGGQYSWN